MSRIGILYKIEELIQDKTPEERYLERQKQSRPVVDAFFEWLHSMEDSVDRSSLIGDAILYALNQETYLRRSLEDGHLSIDNNSAERAIKNFAVGRRNWLFSKSIRGADASATIYSITETALLNGLKPYLYLTYVLDQLRRMGSFPEEEKLDQLLPWSKELPEELLWISCCPGQKNFRKNFGQQNKFEPPFSGRLILKNKVRMITYLPLIASLVTFNFVLF